MSPSRLLSSLRLVLCVCALWCATAQQAHALSVDQIRFGVHSDRTRMVLDLSEATEFRVFVLDNPYRMIVDMPSFSWNAGSIQRPQGVEISKVRKGAVQPGLERIVFDLVRPVAVRSAFLLPAADGKPNRLVVDFAPVDAASFLREKDNIHGPLTIGEAAGNGLQAMTQEQSLDNGSFQTASLGGMIPPADSGYAGPTEKPLVVLDPGHGGADPGAIGANKVFEKNVTLALAHEVKRQLLESGRYRVLMTRETDVFIKLKDRVKFARQHEADLFVSLHADSVHNSETHGSSIYTLSEKASDEQTAKLADRENRSDLIAGVDLNVEDEEVANILVDLAMRDTMNQSRFFAGKLVNTFNGNGLHTLDNPHRFAGFAVLKAPDIPSVLIEAGFMSSARESRQLSTPEHREKLARAIAHGIDVYFEQVQKNNKN